jgi:hypothetical protein
MKTIFTLLVFLPIITFAQCDQWYYGTIRTEVRGDTVILKDDTAHRNCGAEYWMRIYQYSHDTITWIQQDIGTSFACMCTYNLSATIDSLGTGHYFVKTYYTDIWSGMACYIGLTEFDITEQNSYEWGTKIDDAQSECFQVGIRDHPGYSDNEITVYPNPSSNSISIKTGSPGKKSIRIVDINGRCLFETSTTEDGYTINVSGYPDGLYFISVVQENTIYNRKFCKF